MAGFAYDDFKRAADLIKVGEVAMRKALPEVRKWIETTADTALPTVERRSEPQTAPMPARTCGTARPTNGTRVVTLAPD